MRRARRAAPWAALVAVLPASLACSARDRPLPVMTEIPAFELIDQDGQPFGTAQLKGHPWVASFFFTSCVTVCPKIMSAVKTLALSEDPLARELHLVTLTVDPATDTPDRLSTYAKDFQIDTSRWHLLTGTEDAIKSAVVGALKSHMGTPYTMDSGLIEIGHGAHLLLVDEQSRLRGVYPHEPEGLERLLDHLPRIR